MEFWVYFSAQPLFWLIVTLGVFLLSIQLNQRLGATPLLHPVLIALALIILFLMATGTAYTTYFEGAQFIHFLLGPATVALAIPLFDHRHRIRRLALPILIACIVGALTAMLTALAVGAWLGLPADALLSLAPKSVTSPIALGIAEKIGGHPALAAGLVLITGAMGCFLGPWVFRWMKLEDEAVQGFALGLSAHGFGTVQALSISHLAGAFAGLAMGLTGLLTAFLLPLVTRALGLSP